MTGLRVLTVDDSRTILAMLHHTLSNAGFEVLQAEDGKQGLEVLKSSSVDVVITDINMPNMDGYGVIRHLRQSRLHKGIEFIKNVRASGQHQSLPILILTTETSQDKRDQGKAAGGTGWIVKPFDPEKLISVIHRVVH
jgi:two-component system chemotaxis response regulator CheY